MILVLAVAVAVAACGNDTGTGDDTPAIDAPPGPFDVGVQCTSGTHWKLGEQRSPLMQPGVACNACHESKFDAPRFAIAGTIYMTGHEPDMCNGAAGATITITDAAGMTLALPSNTAGNFYSELGVAVTFPIRARVDIGGETRVMADAVMTGDCNSCHTQDGTQRAPGRIVLP